MDRLAIPELLEQLTKNIPMRTLGAVGDIAHATLCGFGETGAGDLMLIFMRLQTSLLLPRDTLGEPSLGPCTVISHPDL
jgi:hypothetical protein